MRFDVRKRRGSVGYHPRRMMVNFRNVIGLTGWQFIVYSDSEARFPRGVACAVTRRHLHRDSEHWREYPQSVFPEMTDWGYSHIYVPFSMRGHMLVYNVRAQAMLST